MKINIIIIALIVPLLGYKAKTFCASQPIMTLFMKPYPVDDAEKQAKVVTKKLKNPEKFASYLVPDFGAESVVGGIFSTYHGYLGVSDFQGQTTFPLQHEKTIVYYLITPKIFPVIMFGNTVHHWEIIRELPTALYKLEQKKEEELNQYYWQVSKEPLPENNIISRKAIVIFADPKKIYVPEGITPVENSPHNILPPVYIKRGLAKAHNVFYVLSIRQFFQPASQIFMHDALRKIIRQQ